MICITLIQIGLTTGTAIKSSYLKDKQAMYKIANFISVLIGVGVDYILHFGVCSLSASIIGIASFLVVNHFFGYTPALIASLFGAVFALGLSVGKESGDKNNPNSGWSWGDLVADGLGITAGLAVNMAIKAIIN